MDYKTFFSQNNLPFYLNDYLISFHSLKTYLTRTSTPKAIKTSHARTKTFEIFLPTRC